MVQKKSHIHSFFFAEPCFLKEVQAFDSDAHDTDRRHVVSALELKGECHTDKSERPGGPANNRQGEMSSFGAVLILMNSFPYGVPSDGRTEHISENGATFVGNGTRDKMNEMGMDAGRLGHHLLQ